MAGFGQNKRNGGKSESEALLLRHPVLSRNLGYLSRHVRYEVHHFLHKVLNRDLDGTALAAAVGDGGGDLLGGQDTTLLPVASFVAIEFLDTPYFAKKPTVQL